jgi:hypothetical protein
LPYQKPAQGQPDGSCTVCGSPANLRKTEFMIGTVVDCSACGDFKIDHVTARDFKLPLKDEKQKALARHLIRRMQQHGRVELGPEFFVSSEPGDQKERRGLVCA